MLHAFGDAVANRHDARIRRYYDDRRHNAIPLDDGRRLTLSPELDNPFRRNGARTAPAPLPPPRTRSVQRLNVAGTGDGNHPGGPRRTAICGAFGRYPYSGRKRPSRHGLAVINRTVTIGPELPAHRPTA